MDMEGTMKSLLRNMLLRWRAAFESKVNKKEGGFYFHPDFYKDNVESIKKMVQELERE